MSTRIYPTSVTVGGTLGGVTLVGGSTCLSNSDDSSYLTWTIHDATGTAFSDSATYTVDFGTITWPSSGWAELHYRATAINDTNGLPWINTDPYQPGYGINHRLVTGFGDISTVDDEITHGYTLRFLEGDPFIDFPSAPSSFVSGGTVAGPSFYYLGFRIYECWLEFVTEGTAADSESPAGLMTSAVVSNGYDGETAWKGSGPTARVQNIGNGNVYAEYRPFFANGTVALCPLFDTDKIAVTRKDLRGLQHLRFDSDLDQQQSTSIFYDQEADTTYYMYEWQVVPPDPPWVPNTDFGWYIADMGDITVGGYYGKLYYMASQEPMVHYYSSGYIWSDVPVDADNIGLIIAPSTWDGSTATAFPSDYAYLNMDEDVAYAWDYVEHVGGVQVDYQQSGTYPSGDVGFGAGPDIPSGWKVWLVWSGPANDPTVDPVPSMSPQAMVPYIQSTNSASGGSAYEFRAKEINANGTELRDISFGPIYNGDSYQDDPPHPATGGVHNGLMTYIDNFGDYNTGGGTPNWFGEFAHQIDLSSGTRRRATELDWIFDPTALSLPDDAQTYVIAMAVDPSDGTYWFNMNGDGHYIASIPSDYGDPRGRYSLGWYIAHLDVDGTLLGYLDMHTAYEGSIYALGGIMATGGAVYAHCDVPIYKITGDTSSPGYEYSAVWMFTGDNGFREVVWDDTSTAYYHQGIWGIEAFVQLIRQSPCGPLYVKMKDHSWFYVGCEEC